MLSPINRRTSVVRSRAGQTRSRSEISGRQSRSPSAPSVGRFSGRSRIDGRARAPRTNVPTHTCGSIDAHFFDASLDLAGAAATQAPLPSLPALLSHFILAFSQSVLLVGVAACCAMAVGANASSAITVVIGNSFMSRLHCLPVRFADDLSIDA